MQSKPLLGEVGFEVGRKMQKSSLVKMSPSIIRSDCNVCSEHLEAFGFLVLVSDCVITNISAN